MPGGYTDAGDPVMASNPTSSGFHPRRLYLAGRTWNNNTNQITVWHRENIVGTWSIDTGIGNVNHGADKPAIAVSQASNTYGHVYMAYIETYLVEVSPNVFKIQYVIHLFKNASDGNGNDDWREVRPSGQAIFTPPIEQPVMGPRVDVDPGSGTIYLSWLNWTTNKVHVMVGDNVGIGTADGTWSMPQLDNETTTTFLTNNGGGVSPSGVFSPSFAMSSFNAATGSLALVYHRRKIGTTDTSEVVMRSYNRSTGFTVPRAISTLGGTHVQWQGAVACRASDGTCVVSYYDHDTDAPIGTDYNAYDRRVYGDGAPIPGEGDVPLYPQTSNASVFVSSRMEYHDVAYWNLNGQWVTANVIALSGDARNSDVIVTLQ
jgi:hypothetical protein